MLKVLLDPDTKYFLVRENDLMSERGIVRNKRMYSSDPAEAESAIEVGKVVAVTNHSSWWRTSLVTEILSDSAEKVVFKTLNSTYTMYKD